MDVAEIAASSALSRSIANLDHQGHVLLVVLDGLLEKRLDLFGELTGVLVRQSTDVLALKNNKKENGGSKLILEKQNSQNLLNLDQKGQGEVI